MAEFATAVTYDSPIKTDRPEADATRCLGITGFLEAAALTNAFAVPFSAHTVPAIHAVVGCVVPRSAHVEDFHDHARIERMFFAGTLEPVGGCLRPNPERPGLGLTLERAGAERYAI